MNIGVRFDIRDPIMIGQFHRAFRFWEGVLDVSVYDEQSSACTVSIEPATRDILGNTLVIARAQVPDRLNFNGLIAVDPDATKTLSDDEAVATWIHEIGHLLGLKHNPDPQSLMYFLDVDGSSKLDEADLLALASLHALRRTPSQLPQLANLHPVITNPRQHLAASN